MIGALQKDGEGPGGFKRDANWLRDNLENEEAVLDFLDDPHNQLEDQPTDVLIELAQKLKERRTKHYEDMLKMQEEQDARAKAVQEASKKLVEEKENELHEDMRKAMLSAQTVGTDEKPNQEPDGEKT